MTKDSFTGGEMSSHKGIHVLKNDGTTEYYGSSKSFKNALKLGRDKRKLKWTEAYRLARQHAEREKVRHASVNKEITSEVKTEAETAKREKTKKTESK